MDHKRKVVVGNGNLIILPTGIKSQINQVI